MSFLIAFLISIIVNFSLPNTKNIMVVCMNSMDGSSFNKKYQLKVNSCLWDAR